ncbi:MAG TPA: Dyp-type peroxidase [Vicinamibacterales bacterium]|nr:Dyp-type peroxidase [Vicinamibacterales bacterium]
MAKHDAKKTARIVRSLPFQPAAPALARHVGSPLASAAVEEVLDVRNIQGNILAGFNKDHQALLFLKITDAAKAKRWLQFITPSIATMDEVVSFNRLFKAMRARRADEPCGLVATWLNIAFSRDAIETLTSSAEAARFRDEAFQAGLPARSSLLGDPTALHAPGSPKNWKFGRPGAIPDVVLTVASDDVNALQEEVDHLKTTLKKIPGATASGGSGLTLMFDQRGNTLPGALRGHEHFGFKDGISQPAVRGRLSEAPDDFLTARYVDPADSRAKLLSTPGSVLVYPGQFVFGYERQDANGDGALPFDPTVVPAWAKNGSYLVIRRLRQDVKAFRDAMSKQAKRLAKEQGFKGVSAATLAAKLVGRWPSGAPVARSPEADDEALGKNDFANNHFAYQDDTTPVPLKNAPPHRPDDFAQSRADLFGFSCPHAAHVRKVNPRDLATDTGGAHDTLTRRILRRGIPYGDPLPRTAGSTSSANTADRGLLFVCYQTSIENQFEFLTNHWVNATAAPEDGGFDVIIGQNGGDAARQRTADLPALIDPTQTLTFTTEWVVPTGGGYFFAPSIEALATVLSV